MKTVEIFQSIDGEGIRQGALVNFIRLAGCNLSCTYCDTKYANDEREVYKNYSIKELVEILKTPNFNNTNLITLTGGEPLLNQEGIDLANKLASLGYKVNIETNGSIDISSVVENCLITMDYKTTTSGYNHMMKLSNFELLKPSDVLKIVCDPTDFAQIEDLLTSYSSVIKSYIYLSPIYNKTKMQSMVDFMTALASKLPELSSRLRIQIQLHKLIWGNEKRGV